MDGPRAILPLDRPIVSPVLVACGPALAALERVLAAGLRRARADRGVDGRGRHRQVAPGRRNGGARRAARPAPASPEQDAALAGPGWSLSGAARMARRRSRRRDL